MPCLFPPTLLTCHPWSLSRLGSHCWLGVVSRQPSNERLIEIPLKPLLSGFPDLDQSLSAPKGWGPDPLFSRILEMFPSPQDLWRWGPQLKLPSWECSLLGPSAGCCGPGWDSGTEDCEVLGGGSTELQVLECLVRHSPL